MQKKKWLKIEIPAKGKRGWENGGYTLNWVYSNKGNFLLTGYFGEVEEWLKDFVSKGGKYFLNRQFYCKGETRGYWHFWKENVYIRNAYKSRYRFTALKVEATENPRWKKKEISTFTPDRVVKSFKRFPNKWVEEFEQF